MKSYRQELVFNIPGRMGFVNITPQVRKALQDSGIKEGLLLCNAMHITASVFINDNEPGLHSDYEKWLEELAPHEPVTAYREAHGIRASCDLCVPYRTNGGGEMLLCFGLAESREIVRPDKKL